MGAPDESRWRVLARFLAPLRRWTDVETCARDGHLQSDCVGLVVFLPVESSAAEQRGFRVALDLLNTLWRLDRAAWRLAVVEALGVAMPASLVVPEQERLGPMTVVVSVKHDKFTWQLNAPRWETLVYAETRLQEEEMEAKRQLLERYGVEQWEDPAIQLRLQFLIFGMATNNVEAYVTKVVEVVQTIRELVTRGNGSDLLDCCARLELHSVDVDVSPYEMTNGIASQLIRLQSLGTPLHRVSVRLVRYEPFGEGNIVDTTVRDNLLTTMLADDRREDARGPSSSSRYDCETVVIERADCVQFEAACAALATTKRVKNLQLHNVFSFDSAADRNQKWAWLSQAIFSPHSLTSIKHVSINQHDFEMADVAAVQAQLRSHREVNGESHHHVLETMAIGSEGTHLETVEVIPLLLEEFGRNLRSLSIYLWMGHLTANAVDSILRTCRALQFLDLSSVVVDSLDIFLEAYDQHNCQIRTLALHNVEVPSASVTTFAQALGDPTRKASRVIKELCVDSVGVDNELDQENIDAFTSLVRASRKLEYLELRVPIHLFEQNRAAFEAHHLTWGLGAAAPFPTKSKAAFLSVIRPIIDGRMSLNELDFRSRLLELTLQLDDHTLALVFEFAAARVWRQVYIDEP